MENNKNENTSKSDTKNTDKLLTKQLQAAENIKHYSNMLDDKIKYNGKKFDVTA